MRECWSGLSNTESSHGAQRLSTEQRRKALSLVEAALIRSRAPECVTSSLVEDAARVARLIGDHVSLIWLELELRHVVAAHERLDVRRELIQELGEERVRALQTAAVEYYLEERAVALGAPRDYQGEDQVDGSSVGELEAKIRLADEVLPTLEEDMGAAEMRMSRHAQQLMLIRIRTRVLRYLTRMERVLGLGDDADAMFDQFRAETDMRLGAVCPEGLTKFSAACSAFMRQESESSNHALTSCRRLIKAVADALYPASSGAAIGADGALHEIGEDNYINRLVQWVYENHPKGKEREIVASTVNELHARLVKLNDLASKGVHGEVAHDEIRFGLIQTYMTLGEVLRLGPLHAEEE